jgi:hypothetical protein
VNDEEILAEVRSIFGHEPTDADEAFVYDQAKRCLQGEHDYRVMNICSCCGDALWPEAPWKEAP